MKLEEHYWIARRVPEVRQEFLDSVDLGEKRKYIKRVSYCNDPKKYTGKNKSFNYMTTEERVLHNLGIRGIPARIVVYPPAFKKLRALDEFLGVLIDHEGQHAEDLYKRPHIVIFQVRDLFGGKSFVMEQERRRSRISEVRAYKNELRNKDQRRYSKRFVRETRAGLDFSFRGGGEEFTFWEVLFGR